VIAMEKRILSYRKRIDELLQQEDANWEKILKEHLTQVAFFQHERLIHLIVTVLFAVLEIMSILGTVVLAAMESGNIAMSLLTILLLILLIPYIRHYYILENEVQKMYVQYDKLLEKIEEKNK
jgi:ABC-type antimicrobial peptide transport system permease subunit